MVNEKDSKETDLKIIFLRHICYIGSQEGVGIICKVCKMKRIMNRALDLAFEKPKPWKMRVEPNKLAKQFWRES